VAAGSLLEPLSISVEAGLPSLKAAFAQNLLGVIQAKENAPPESSQRDIYCSS